MPFSRTDTLNSRDKVLVLGNFNVEAQTLPLETIRLHGFSLQDGMKDLISSTRIEANHGSITLPPLSSYWLTD